MKRIISVALVILILNQSTIAFAQFSPPNNMAAISAREYFVGRDLGKALVTVHLLNGVNAPGVYHIPADTDIAQLIALAGGATERSDLRGITVRRHQRGDYSIVDLDLEKSLRNEKDLFRLANNDVIQIDQRFSAERPLQWVGIVSALASIVLSVYLVKDIQSKD